MLWDTVRKSTRKKFHDDGPQKRKVRSPNLVRSRDVYTWCMVVAEQERKSERVALADVGCSVGHK